METTTIKSHMVSLGFSVDQASQKKMTDTIDSLNTALTQFAQRAVLEVGKAALAVLGFDKALHTVKVPKGAKSSPPTPAGSGSGSGGGNGTGSSPVAMEQSLHKTEQAASSASSGLKHFANAATKYFGEASVAVGAFALAATGGMTNLLNGLGNQQIQMQMLARQMWTTQQQAYAFSLSLKVLHANLQDLYLSPTLMKQYEQLHAVALKIAPPKGYSSAVSQVQNVSLQVKQLQLESYYALQWIGFYFIKYMEGPITNVTNILESINGVVIKKMPKWTQQVAQVMASFMQAGVYVGKALGSIYHWLVKMVNYMPGWAKGVAAAVAVVSLTFDAGPLGVFALALSGAILLLDDFKTYLNGGKSAFPGFWAWLVKLNTGFAKLKLGVTVGKDIHTTFTDLGVVFQHVSQWFLSMVKTLTANGAFKALGTSISQWGRAWGHLFNAVGKALSSLFAGLTGGKNQNAMANFGKLMTGALSFKVLALVVKGFAALINIQADAISSLVKLVHWFAKMGTFAAIITGIAAAFATWMGIMTAIDLGETLIIKGMYAWEAITKVMTALQLAFDGVLTANPIGIVVVAVGALVTGLILVATHLKTVETWLKNVWTWFKELGKGAGVLVPALMPFVTLPALILKQWSPLKKFFANLWSGISQDAGSTWDAIVNGFNSAINGIIKGLNAVIRVTDMLPGIRVPLIPLIGASQTGKTGQPTYDAAGNPVPSHAYVNPKVSTSNKTTHVTVSQTNHITSSSPEATAAAVHAQFNRHLVNVRGVIG